MVNCQKKGDNLIVKLMGEIDHHSSESIRNEIDMAYEQNNCVNIILDFSQVEFMDSSGIGLIIGRYKLVEAKGGKAIIASVKGNMDRILKISGIYRLMEYYDNVDDALSAC